MSVQLNHTIVHSRDKHQAAHFLISILGLPAPIPFSHFLVVQVSNNVSLDFMNHQGTITPQHYAFLVSDKEFDQIFARIEQRELMYWADPMREQAREINTRDGGRAFYFEDPSGHMLEVLTRPYGSGSKS